MKMILNKMTTDTPRRDNVPPEREPNVMGQSKHYSETTSKLCGMNSILVKPKIL